MTAFIEKPSPGEADVNTINAGTYVIEPDVLDLIPAGKNVSVEREVFPRLVGDGLYARSGPVSGSTSARTRASGQRTWRGCPRAA